MKAVVFKEEIVVLWEGDHGRATVGGVTFGSRGPFPEGVSVVMVISCQVGANLF